MQNQHIHFIGIGGIGMSALAQIYKAQGYTISGCDSSLATQIISDLQANGCIIAPIQEHELCFDPSITTYVYSTAIRTNSKEILHAQQHNIPLLHRSDLLAQLCNNHDTIAISGSHGKTTTTTLTNHIFTQAAYDPTAIIGGYCNIMGKNYRIGKSNYVIAEADESDRSFLKLPKTIGILTNIDFEHAETYKNIQDLQQTCIQFGTTIPDHGCMIVCNDSPALKEIIPHLKNPKTYGMSSTCEYRIKNLQTSLNGTSFELYHHSTYLGALQLPLIGAHYAYNATAAAIAALHYNIPFTVIQQACATFQGALRRFTKKGTFLPENITIIDDYAHHPTEIKATFDTSAVVAKNNIIVIFQPHRYTRFQALWDDFKAILQDPRIQHVIVTDVYAASEPQIMGIDSKTFVEEINKPHITYCALDDTFEEIATNLKKIIQNDDLVLTIGAGNITHFAKNLK